MKLAFFFLICAASNFYWWIMNALFSSLCSSALIYFFKCTVFNWAGDSFTITASVYHGSSQSTISYRVLASQGLFSMFKPINSVVQAFSIATSRHSQMYSFLCSFGCTIYMYLLGISSILPNRAWMIVLQYVHRFCT